MRTLTGTLLAIALFLPAPSFAQAVLGTEGFLTWRAETYVPHGYGGKALPTQSSFVSAAFELIEGGKQADLSGRELRWFLDDALFTKGRGLKTTRFQATVGNDNSHFVRVQVTDGRNILFEKSAEIPVVRPRVNIVPPFLENVIGRGAHEFSVVPFFFNVKSLDELLFAWTVNSQTPSAEGADEPSKLAVAVPGYIASGTPLVLSAFAANKNDQTERASKELRFSVK